MASNALLFSCSFPSNLRRNLTSYFSINPSRTTSRLAFSGSHMSSITEAGENHSLQPLEEERLSLKHFFEQANALVTSDVGLPHWFSPSECGHPLQDSALLLFLPGIDGTGVGLIMHHKKLGKIFEVLCLHIPPKDRTPYTELVKQVERKIRSEHYRSPGRPIYLVGESLGACLALSVASLNPDFDLVLLLANPATSFSKSPLQPILPFLQFMSNILANLSLLLGVLSSMAGDLIADLEKGVGRLSRDLVTPSVLADIMPIETLLWKLQMLNLASSHAKLHLHAVKAQTLILTSGRDPLLPSHEEGLRLQRLLPNCEIRTFGDCGHFLFLEDAFDLVTVIKQVGAYRRSKERDFVLDYTQPSPSELKDVCDKYRWMSMVMSPVILSTLAEGDIVRDFAGIPSDGPVVYVSIHMLLGLDVFPLVTHFLEQKGVHLRGIAHPVVFQSWKQGNLPHLPFSDNFALMGAGVVPVSGKSFFRLLSTKSHVLLYPGGVLEALHRKGEAYKLFWPERSEFVRMAARFGAKIVPFGVVGEDDFGDVIFDYEDRIKIPFLKKFIDELTEEAGKLRTTIDGEEGNQDVHFPGFLPKPPGRLYYYFGKPIETEGLYCDIDVNSSIPIGRKEELRDWEKAHELYLQVKLEVQKCITYLQEKRESDPYRSLSSRLLFQARHGFTSEVPAFDLD